MNFEATIQDLEKLDDAVKNFRVNLGVSQGLGPDALPGHMSCGEANAFSDLFEALGLTEEASSLREWHLFDEGPEEKNEQHENWPEEGGNYGEGND